MKKIKLLFLALLTSVTFMSFGGVVLAADTPSEKAVCEGIGVTDCVEPTDGVTVNKMVRTIVRVLSVLVGAVAVIMIIVGAFKYITSAGNDASIKSAKSTIMYAVIGLIIAVLTQILIRFVLTEVSAVPSDPSVAAIRL